VKEKYPSECLKSLSVAKFINFINQLFYWLNLSSNLIINEGQKDITGISGQQITTFIKFIWKTKLS
jgi:hypothetical protein